jgi:hypothetical protein
MKPGSRLPAGIDTGVTVSLAHHDNQRGCRGMSHTVSCTSGVPDYPFVGYRWFFRGNVLTSVWVESAETREGSDRSLLIFLEGGQSQHQDMRVANSQRQIVARGAANGLDWQ